ncbi:MAG: hypothetical protein MJ095_00660 [Oscillospiraceae bacterium]|nr:hypothetical protein [Oscillospiraceae bacterium]
MENLVNKIIEIDSQADQRLCDAESEGRELIEKSEKEAEELKESLRVRAEKRMNLIRDFHKNETEEALSRINGDCSEKIKELDEIFENQHLSIEESIFHTIVGGSVD